MIHWNGSILKGKGFTRQAKRAFDVHTEEKYRHSQYEFNTCLICETKGRQPLIIGSLKPRGQTLPSFSLRWDPHGNHLDVDIEEVSQQVKELFNEGKQGYRGHRPKMVAEKSFDVNVGIPTQDVFIGKISFKVHENIVSNENVGIGDKMVEIPKKDWESRTIE